MFALLETFDEAFKIAVPVIRLEEVSRAFEQRADMRLGASKILFHLPEFAEGGVAQSQPSRLAILNESVNSKIMGC